MSILLISGCGVKWSKGDGVVHKKVPVQSLPPVVKTILLPDGLESNIFFSNRKVLSFVEKHWHEWLSYYNQQVELGVLPKSHAKYRLRIYTGRASYRNLYFDNEPGTQPSWHGETFDALVLWMRNHPQYAEGRENANASNYEDWPPRLTLR
jgi:hypothetical protein